MTFRAPSFASNQSKVGCGAKRAVPAAKAERAAVGSVRRLSPGGTAMGETRR